MKQLLELYGDVEAFLRQYDQEPATCQKLLQLFSRPAEGILRYRACCHRGCRDIHVQTGWRWFSCI